MDRKALKRFAPAIGVALVAVAVALLVATTGNARQQHGLSHLVAIPISAQQADVVGSFDELRASGFRVALTKSVYISDLRAPFTQRLVPKAGTRVPRGSVVRVVPGFSPSGSPSVLKANPHYRVPNFVGKRASMAIAWATRKSMFWAIPHLPALVSSSAPHLFDAYRVLAQQPRPGGTIRQGFLVGQTYHPTPLTLTVTRRADVNSAAGKNSDQARLLAKLPLKANPGSFIRVKWTVEDRSTGKPFGAGGMFVRLTGTPGHSMESFAPLHPPPYVAWVGVPLGGIKQIKLGLLGWTQGIKGGTVPAPVYFPIVNSPFKHH